LIPNKPTGSGLGGLLGGVDAGSLFYPVSSCCESGYGVIGPLVALLPLLPFWEAELFR
jgi:hypothetical protein